MPILALIRDEEPGGSSRSDGASEGMVEVGLGGRRREEGLGREEEGRWKGGEEEGEVLPTVARRC